MIDAISAFFFVLLTFQSVQGECTGGYIAVSGDIGGWGSVNGIGGGQRVSSCSACISLCDQQGAACLSTECSPSTLQCNLNARSDVDTTIGFLDFAFCKKPGNYMNMKTYHCWTPGHDHLDLGEIERL
jgi:hypothetical protein